MAQFLPTPGGDDGTWGPILNGFLLVTLNEDGTLSAVVNVEQITRQQFLDQLQPPQGSVYFNGQDLVGVATLAFAEGGGFGQLGTLTIADGTASHGSLVLAADSSLGPGIRMFANSTDTQPLIAFGDLFGAGGLFLGPGGSTQFDVSLRRTSPGVAALDANTLGMTDGTAGDGEVKITLGPAFVSIFANSGDTQPVVEMGNFAGTVPVLAFGAGGSSNPDVTLSRSAGNTLGIQATAGVQMTKLIVEDATAGHGSITASVNSPALNFYGTSTDTQPLIFVGEVIGGAVLGLGPGGSTTPDVIIKRGGSNALDIGASVGTLFSGPIVATPGTAQTLSAGTTVNPNSSRVKITATGSTTLTATPAITAGTDGQDLVITNVGTNPIVFQSNGTLAGSALSLGATTRSVGAKGALALTYDGTLSEWVEYGFNVGGFG